MILNRRIAAAIHLIVVYAICTQAGTAHAQTPLFEVLADDTTTLLRLNSDGGFALFNSATGNSTIPAEGNGSKFMWYAGKFAVRGGLVSGTQWNDDQVGAGSVAFGYDTRAVGLYSVALGMASHAGGQGAFASGARSLARGYYSLAIGEDAVADGRGSLALGIATRAGGQASFAMGEATRAHGNGSVALGHTATAQGNGSFIFGDLNTNYQRPAQANQFVVRAFGGILLNTGPFIGCELAHNSGTWSCASSRTVKEGFEDTDGEEILGKVAGLSIRRWRYIGSEAEHIGPIAEEFRQAFGLGSDSTKIDGIDADGIALRAIQALERRTAAMQEAITAMQATNVALEADNAALRSELDALRLELIALRARIAAQPKRSIGTATDADGVR
jgi:hypothetical protein